MSLTNEIVIIRLAGNTINNDEMQQAQQARLLTYNYLLVL